MKLRAVQIILSILALGVMVLSYLTGVPDDAGVLHPKVLIPGLLFMSIPGAWVWYWTKNRFFSDKSVKQ